MNRQFPALRGLAIAIVVLHHSIRLSTLAIQELGYAQPTGWEQYLLLGLLQLGIFAVPTFLFISGSFFVYAAQGENPKLSYRTVWAGLKHLLWPYLFWSIIFYIVIYFGYGTSYSILGYVKNLIVGYPFNFIPLLVFYYVFSPILVRLSKRFGWIIIGILTAFQLVLINIVNPGSLGFSFPGWMKYLAPPVLSTTMADWGIFFPLGIIYSLKARNVTPLLVRLKWLFAALSIAFYALSILSVAKIIHFPLAAFIAPFMLMMFLPSIRRDAVPYVRQLEKVGKRSYGLYLTNLIVLFLILVIVKALIPGVLHYQIFLLPFLFAVTLLIPITIMGYLERMPVRRVYPYVFG